MSIHPLNNIDGYKEKQKPSEVLKRASGFDDADLAFNQEHKMSVSQRLRCLTKRNWLLLSGLLCVLAFLITWYGSRALSYLSSGFPLQVLYVD